MKCPGKQERQYSEVLYMKQNCAPWYDREVKNIALGFDLGGDLPSLAFEPLLFCYAIFVRNCCV